MWSSNSVLDETNYKNHFERLKKAKNLAKVVLIIKQQKLIHRPYALNTVEA